MRLGGEPGQLVFSESFCGSAPIHKLPLALIGIDLPFLNETEEKSERPIWKHPTFVISCCITVAILGGLATWFAFGVFSEPEQVTQLELVEEENHFLLSWEGTNQPYTVTMTSTENASVDLSYLIRGLSAWIPRANNFVPANSCFLVRPANIALNEEMATEKDLLAGQKGASICLT